MIFLGIDPGASGAVAVIDDGGKALYVAGPDFDALDAFWRDYRACCANTGLAVATIEKPLEQFRPFMRDGKIVRTNSKAIVGNAISYGRWRGWLQARGIRDVTAVAPTSWQTMLAGIPGETAKKRVIFYLRNYRPEWFWKCWGLRGGWLDGRADALCIAEYGMLAFKRRAK